MHPSQGLRGQRRAFDGGVELVVVQEAGAGPVRRGDEQLLPVDLHGLGVELLAMGLVEARVDTCVAQAGRRQLVEVLVGIEEDEDGNSPPGRLGERRDDLGVRHHVDLDEDLGLRRRDGVECRRPTCASG
jgi:hypothetical protein